MTQSPICVGIVSAGAMGSGLGRAWRAGGARVVTTIDGRSERTSRLARAAGVELLADLDDVVRSADLVVSVGPPDRAVAMATSIASAAARAGAHPVVADLNAVSPQTIADVADALATGGLTLIDGSISGGPPEPGGATRLYLSGPRAAVLADLTGDGIDARVVGDLLGTASAVKMCTASVFKGFTALLAQAMLTARVHGVEDLVLDDLAQDFPELRVDLPRDLALAASKAWRYVGEMRQISATQDAAGACPELFEAMAVVWAMVSERGLAERSPEDAARATSLADVLDDLARIS